jgi:hypothetical protein
MTTYIAVAAMLAFAVCNAFARGTLADHAQWPPEKATVPEPAYGHLPPESGPEDCRLRRAYFERSQACFARFRTARGVKPEAFRVCGAAVLDPSPDCGLAPTR